MEFEHRMTAEALPSWKDLLAQPGLNGHIVQLYQDDEFFGAAVSHFAAEGLLRRESIITVATAPHWDNISTRLSDKGFDLAELRRRGQLTLLDADETLPKFLVKDMPDARTFKGLAQATIKKARAENYYPRVRWWGEMVNVLYVDGNGRASTRLEELFDEVAHEESIAIFCSFSMDKFDRSVYDGPLQDVCRTHAHLIPAENYDLLRECVDRALAEVFGGEQRALLSSLSLSNERPEPGMPPSQALLLSLKKTLPRIADRVIDVAREYEQKALSRNHNRSDA
ncbi:MAG: MEDS domain-containing protein [Candidatus Binatia bacterium]